MTSDATFRDLSADDVPAALALGQASGWNQTEADWRVLLGPPSVFRAALAGGRVVGTAGAVVYGDRLAWVCMVLVDPAERGRGLGTELVAQVLERLPSVAAVGLDATPKGRPVYQKLGFRGATTIARLETTAPAGGLALPPRARPLTDVDLPRIVARDRSVFGADRERVLRHAFASAPEYAWCVGEGSAVEAYGFGRHGASAEHIGPIVADTFPAALDLVTACLSRHPERRFFVDAPPWREWRAALVALGFHKQRPFTRMYRSGLSPRGRPEQVYAALGPEFG